MSLKYNCPPLLVLLLLCLFSCKQKTVISKKQSLHHYSIYILGKDDKEYILETDTLDQGIIYPEKEGAMLNSKDLDRDVIVHKGYYYHINRKKGFLYKYQSDHNLFETIDSLELKNFSIENRKWLGGDTLMLTGFTAPAFGQIKYVLLRTDTLKMLAYGNMDIPASAGKYNKTSVGFVNLRYPKLFVGYTYHQQSSTSDYITSDTTYVTELNFPEMTAVKTDKDTRSTYPGGLNTIQPYAFNDEKLDYYFMVCPGIALGNRPELPSGIMRIKATENHIDKNYFINLSSSISHNHAYGMWYLGKGKAIIRSERKDLFKGLEDHYSVAQFEFYLVDIVAEKVLKKLDLPLDKGTRRECVIVKGDIAYISVNSSTEGNYIWIYNILSGNLKKGLQLAGTTDFIMRIDELK